MTAPVLHDWVAETTITTGLLDWVLAGAVASYRAIGAGGAAVADGATVYYSAQYWNGTSMERESGIGTYVAGTNTLQRTTVLASTNSGNKVSFSGGPTITITLPSAKALTRDTGVSVDAAQAFSAAEQAQGRANISAALRGHWYNVKLSNNVADATNGVDISAGEVASDAASPVLMTMAALTKLANSAWAVGSGNGGLDDGTIANGNIYHYAIKRLDTGVTDVLQSLSPPDRAGTVTISNASPAVVTWTKHGLQAGSRVVFTTTGALPTGLTAGTVYYVLATSLAADSFRVSATQGGTAVNTSSAGSGTHTGTSSPKLPSNYTHKRYIGCVRRESATIVPFYQLDRVKFRRVTPVKSNSHTDQGTSAVSRDLRMPTGIEVLAKVRVNLQSTDTGSVSAINVSALRDADLAPSLWNSDGDAVTASGFSKSAVAMRMVPTNMAGQIRTRISFSNGNVIVDIWDEGWDDLNI